MQRLVFNETIHLPRQARDEHKETLKTARRFPQEEMIIADANLGGQGQGSYHTAMQAAVMNGDASQLEGIASTSGSDAVRKTDFFQPFLCFSLA